MIRATRPTLAEVPLADLSFGIQVTRNSPPVPGKDLVDHADFHLGLWMAFGDTNGNDCWRLRAHVRHEGFTEMPVGGPGRGIMTVRNAYMAQGGTNGDSREVVCREVCAWRLRSA